MGHPEEACVGRIVEWSRERGFGYVENGGRRVFLHFREFAERHKAPEVGDRVRFSMGLDRQGRSCATRAVHVNDGGTFKRRDGLILLLLLAAPVSALFHDWEYRVCAWVLGWCAALSGFTYLVYAWDKRLARIKAWRVPEILLHLLEIHGGWPGAFIAQRRLRHKNRKLSYQIVFWLIVAAYGFVAIDSLRGWPAAKHFRLRVTGQ